MTELENTRPRGPCEDQDNAIFQIILNDPNGKITTRELSGLVGRDRSNVIRSVNRFLSKHPEQRPFIEQRRKSSMQQHGKVGGDMAAAEGLGMFGIDENIGKQYTDAGRAQGRQTVIERGLGIFQQTPEERKAFARLGGITARNLGVGAHALTKEEKSEIGRTTLKKRRKLSIKIEHRKDAWRKVVEERERNILGEDPRSILVELIAEKGTISGAAKISGIDDRTVKRYCTNKQIDLETLIITRKRLITAVAAAINVPNETMFVQAANANGLLNKNITARQKEVLELLFLNQNPVSEVTIARHYGVSRQDISDFKKRTIQKLRILEAERLLTSTDKDDLTLLQSFRDRLSGIFVEEPTICKMLVKMETANPHCSFISEVLHYKSNPANISTESRKLKILSAREKVRQLEEADLTKQKVEPSTIEQPVQVEAIPVFNYADLAAKAEPDKKQAHHFPRGKIHIPDAITRFVLRVQRIPHFHSPHR